MGGPVKFFFLVIAAAAPLLSAAQHMAKPQALWINNATLHGNSVMRFTLITDLIRGEEEYFAAGFVCATTPKCDVYLFAVFIVFGFYNSSGKFLVLEDASREVIWSANRDRPVRENATLEFTSDGNLVLHDADGSHVWSSGTSGRSVTIMVITENGNLVLSDQREATVWQSFDHPADTMVPGQSLLQGMRLKAYTSPTNWTVDQFYITVLPDGLNAYYAEGTTLPQLYFSFQTKIGKIANDPTRATFMDGSLSFMLGPDRIENITFPVAHSTWPVAQYIRLDKHGYLGLYEWSKGERSTMVYDIMGSLGMDACAYPTVCGAYGVCNGGQCTCPLENNSSTVYFKLVDDRKPNLGCTPFTPVSCQEIQHHKLLTIPNISYFDYSHTALNAASIDDCKQACLKNCSCMLVLFRARECVWVTKVFSLHAIQQENVGFDSPVYLKVQLIPSIFAPNANRKKVMLAATVGAVTTLVLLLIAVTLYIQRRRKYEEKDEEFDFDKLPGTPTRYSFEKLSECTEGFSKKLGEGGFGSVFEGKLGEVRVAVKRLEGARQGKKEFLAEVETIGSIEHINLVRLIGFCAEKSERLLVYEYMPRGSLDRWIYYRYNNAPLDWCTRCRIILDVAKGLCYLHEECRRKIVHLDIKPQNILLDDNFNAKVADFGLCKLIDRDQSKVVTMMRGTPGYLAPEWLTSRITEKVDVYSFGVVIMEILSGRKNIDNSQPEENVQLINLLREKYQNNQLIDLIDKHSDDMVSHQEEVVQMMKLAIWCLQHDSIQRPSMSTVIKVLEGVISIQTFDANSLGFVQENPSTYSVPSQTSILSGPR
uniref:Uncharacterized protein n=1 Tax=Avena sativa TaxID=4498 RepID=A0ACD5ZDS9_AVESA